MRLRIVVEHLDDIQMRGAVDGIAANADAGGLADAAAGELPDCFVSQSAAAGDDADVAFFVNVTGSNADAAAAVGIFAFAGSDDSGTVRPDQPGLLALHGALDFHHVVDGNAFGDADHQIQSGIDGFQNGVGRKRRRNKNGGSSGAGLFRWLRRRYRRWEPCFRKLAAFAGRDAGDDLRAVSEAKLGVPGAEAAGNALDKNFGCGVTRMAM